MRRLMILSLFVLAGIATQAQIVYPDMPKPLWLYGANSSILFDPTVGPDGSVYFVTLNNRITALNGSGVFKWSAEMNGQALTPVAMQGKLLYVGTSDQQIRAYSIDGNLVWKTTLAKNIKSPIAVSGDNTLYFTCTDGDLYSMEGGTGQVNWHFYVDLQVGPPTVGHSGNVFVAGNAFVHSVNPKNGTVNWRKDFFNFSNVPIAMDSYDDMAYIRRNILDVYDYRGNIMWEAYDDTGVLILVQNVQPIIYGDTLIFAAQGGGDFYGFDMPTGVMKWRFTVANATNPHTWTPAAVSSMAVDNHGVVTYCDSKTGQLAWFDAATGWFFGFMPSNGIGNDFTLAGMGSVGYGVIRSGNGNKTLVGYKMPTGPGAPWSQFGGSPYKQNRRDDPPFLSLLSPTDGQVITGAFTATATATDDFALVDLSIYIDKTLVARTGGSAVSFNANSALFQDGVYNITAVATDSGGNQASATAQVGFVNPPPLFGLTQPPPTFSWMSNGIDGKYEVDISLSPTFNSILTSSASSSKQWIKATAWRPSQKKWSKVQNAARAGATDQTVFYWRAVGQTMGLVTTRSFIIDRTK